MRKYGDNIEIRFTARHRKCINFCGKVEGKKILNIGCYNGWFEKFAIENGATEVIGIDTNENNLVNARNQAINKNVRFLRASVLDLSQFEANYFDLITMFDVIEHLPKNMEEKCLLEVKRVLKNEGSLIISAPNDSFFSKILDPAWYFGHRHYKSAGLYKLLQNAGIKIERVEYGGRFFELFAMILLYIFKWFFRREMPFKHWLDRKRDKEYSNNSGIVTLFVKAVK